jgi:membrane associated rhomboid family serine protease
MTTPNSPKPKAPPLLSWPVTLLLVLIILPELVLIASDAGWIGSRRWRSQAYTYGAFWAGVLGDWTPNYTAQPFAMFFSYSFLHAGAGHLFGNAVALAWLGQIADDRLSPARLFGLYAGSVLGGALAFAALSTSISPMVGASGAIFGLAGAWLIWAWQDQPDTAHAWRFAGQMLRVDMAERIARAAHDARDGKKPFVPDPALSISLGLSEAALAQLMQALGFQSAGKAAGDGPAQWVWRGRRAPKKVVRKPVPGNAFAKLAELDLGHG